MPKINLALDYRKFEAEFKIARSDNETYRWIFFERNITRAKRYIKSCLREEYRNPILIKLEEF